MFLNELGNLDNVLDEIVPEENNDLFDQDQNITQFIESILHIIDDYIYENQNVVAEPDCEEIIREDISELVEIHFSNLIENNLFEEYDDDFDDFNELITFAISLYFNSISDSRSFLHTHNPYSNNTRNLPKITEQINYLKSIPQPEQRTEDWYKYRHKLITASNAYKAFENESTRNQLIYEKCKPLCIPITEENKLVNVNTSLHWGQKYEPLSVMIYEAKYGAHVEDFGCIPHPQHDFIGASPDGIVTNINCERYGRMLEIKNVVSRKITGIPKKEYWIQMQLQMEVCNLDECDFLETKFYEYPNSIEFNNDTENTMENYQKGIIMYFQSPELKPVYIYKQLNIITEEEIDKWTADIHAEMEEKNNIWIKDIYWKLEEYSCVYVTRNTEWFKQHLPKLEEVWRIIENERIHGYEHRAPNKRVEKNANCTNNVKQENNCFLNIIKIETDLLINTDV